MNIFENTERSVSSYSFNKKTLRQIDVVSESFVSNSALRRIDAEEKAKKEEAELEREEKREEENERVAKVVNASMTESRIIMRANQITATAKTELFKDILFEVFYNALLIDSDFLKEHALGIRALTDDYVEKQGGFNKLVESSEKTSSILLKKMRELCESTANGVCKRKIKEMQECGNPNLITFDLTEKEKEKFDYNKQELDIDKIAKLVKDKVLTVIRDDKKREMDNAKILSKIEEELKNDETVVDEASLQEAVNRMIINKDPIETTTLFNALCRSTYRDILTENVAIQSSDKDNIDDSHERARSYDPNATINDINDDDSEDKDIDNVEINMDIVLTEAITKYTLMEMLYTLKLENYTREDVRKLSESLVNPK